MLVEVREKIVIYWLKNTVLTLESKFLAIDIMFLIS